jgi:hypothetical protein
MMVLKSVTILGWVATSLVLTLDSPSRAESCTLLPLVGGQGSEVTKTVTTPTIPGPFGLQITRNNWNTDWAVPGNQQFSRFIVTMASAQGGQFNIRMYLKYSDQTAGEFYNTEGVPLKPGQPLTIEATSRSGDDPYQVNLFVGGLSSIGKTYTASVMGCR